jgi:hypothetical protein
VGVLIIHLVEKTWKSEVATFPKKIKKLGTSEQ